MNQSMAPMMPHASPPAAASGVCVSLCARVRTLWLRLVCLCPCVRVACVLAASGVSVSLCARVRVLRVYGCGIRFCVLRCSAYHSMLQCVLQFVLQSV